MTTNKPACPKCYYDLSGSPTQNERYHCPECGQPTRIELAYVRPSYILSTKKPILIGSVPPVALLVLLIIPPFLFGPKDFRATYTDIFVHVAPITVIWPFIVAVSYAYKINRYKGPDRKLGPYSAFLILWLSASGILSIALSLIMLIAVVINALSSL